MKDGNQKQAEAPLGNGQIIASFGRRYLVELADASVVDCVTRGKRSDLACGDFVTLRAVSPGAGVIEKTTPRTTLLYRSDAYRQKLIAANVTQVVIVTAAVPEFHEDLIDRCLAAAEHGNMAALIVFNKCELAEGAAALAKLELYREIGYPLLALSAKQDIAPLRPRLEEHTSVLVGQSGVGKSTIINRLVPEAVARVAELSAALSAAAPHHDACAALSPRRGQPHHRFAGHAGIRIAPSERRRARACVHRVQATAGPLPFPQLPPSARTGLRDCRRMRRRKRLRAAPGVLPPARHGTRAQAGMVIILF